jgi:hypothetical protein
MSPLRDGLAPQETLLPETTAPLPVPVRRALAVAWPAFLMAGVLEMLTFAVVDPGEWRWFGTTPIGWSAPAVYTVTFLLYWLVISLSGALTALLLCEPPDEPLDRPSRRWP